jgi:hypothetical protein
MEPIEQIKKENPLLAKLNLIPGDTLRLPSKGIFYKNGEVDDSVIDGEVTLKPMTVTDELLMRSPDMLFQGSAIETVIRRCCPQIQKPLDLAVVDVDFIFVNLRKISYGSSLPIQWACEDTTKQLCVSKWGEEKRKSEEYLIPLDKITRSVKEFDPADAKLYVFTLGNGTLVKLRPVRMRDWLQLQQLSYTDLNIEKVKKIKADSYSAMIDSVDGITDQEMIQEWILNLPKKLDIEFENHINKLTKISWGVDFTIDITCKKCKQPVKTALPINPLYFFMLPSSQETE